MREKLKKMNKMNDLIENFANSEILLVGDIMLDRFIYGQVERISPEGPIPILSINKENEMLGAAGNVLANMRALGAKVDIISVVGNDEAGEKVKSLISKTAVNTDHIICDEARPTILKTRYIAQNQQMLRVDHEKNYSVSKEIEKQILDKATRLISSKKILVLSDYGKGLLTDSLIKNLIALAVKNKVTVIVDPKGRDFTKYSGATIITPNRKELSEASGMSDIKTNEAIEDAAKKIIAQYKIKTVIATRSEDGMSVITNEKSLHISTQAREVYDVSGAGDTVVATIATALGAGADLSQAAHLANITGGLVVAKIGTAVIHAEELQSYLSHNEQGSHFIAAILNDKAALEKINQWHAQGLKVGLTNGCFDILHYGHVNYLARAREKCDRLIVAVNKDVSVKILKGPTRPVNDEKARGSVIAALGSCDMVVYFGATKAGEDNTPCALIDDLKPDIYFKGGDYKLAELPETKIVMGYGGKVEIMPLYEGYSTSNIIEKAGNF